MRDLDSSWEAALSAGVIIPALLADLSFVSGTEYVWTGYGPLIWGANTYKGVGRLAGIGGITEGTSVRADGTSVSLSGIDPTLYAESMTEIQTGAPATLWLALFAADGTFIGSPYKLFGGVIDKPDCSNGPEAITITIALESKMTNLKRASCRRYTSGDQNIYWPLDVAFNWVELLNDQPNKWGSA